MPRTPTLHRVLHCEGSFCFLYTSFQILILQAGEDSPIQDKLRERYVTQEAHPNSTDWGEGSILAGGRAGPTVF